VEAAGEKIEERDVFATLLALRSEDDFRSLLDDRPHVLEEENVETLLRPQDLPGYGTVMRALAALLREGAMT
jgi:hypothetical protein